MTASSDPLLPSAVAYSERMESRCFLVSFSAERLLSMVSRSLTISAVEAAHSLGDAFELQSNLAALPAEGFRLRRGGCDLGLQTLLFAADARQPLLGLRELIAQVGSSADRLQNGRAMRFLLALRASPD